MSAVKSELDQYKQINIDGDWWKKLRREIRYK